MDNFKKQIKEYSFKGWSFLKEKLYHFWLFFRRVWKKYHVTKVGLLLVLTLALFISVVGTIQARQEKVTSLHDNLQHTTTIIDDQGEEAGTLYSQKGTFVPIEQISPNIQHDIVSTEDKRFMSHRGFDVIGIGRAAVGYVLQGEIVGGGSTITQQLAKNAYLTLDQTMLRKIKELFLAIEIEKNYSKESILDMYLNNSYFDQGVWGIQDASLKYFNKNAADLSISEAATLAGILKAPTYYNPIDNYEASIERRNLVLRLMTDNESITEEERQVAADQELYLVDGYNNTDDYRYPYYFDSVISEAIDRYELEEKDVLNGGYTIYTNLNQQQQQQMTAIYNQDYLFETADDGEKSQSASISLNPQTGGITAVVGGRGDYTFQGFNRATQMRRQPGSTIKPLSVYAPALEAGYQIEDMLVDEEHTYGEGDIAWSPANVDHTYAGEIPMYQALAESKNAATVWLLDEIGIRRGYNKLKQFGIPVSDEDYHLGAIALGGMDRGVTPLEMASAYSVFANDGVQVEPHFITKIVDATGAVVAENTNPKEKRILSKSVNDDMNRMLLNVFTDGTGQSVQPAGYEVAGKTGTTGTQTGSGNTDQWLVGYTPDLVIASWQGYDKTDENHYLKTSTTAGIGQVLKQEFETMLPYTAQTQFAVDDSDIEVVEKDKRREETIEWIQGTLQKSEEVIKDTGKKAVNEAKKIIKSFLGN